MRSAILDPALLFSNEAGPSDAELQQAAFIWQRKESLFSYQNLDSWEAQHSNRIKKVSDHFEIDNKIAAKGVLKRLGKVFHSIFSVSKRLFRF